MNIKFLFFLLILLNFASSNIYSNEIKVFGYSPGQKFDVRGLEVKEDCRIEYVHMLTQSNQWCPQWGIARFQNPPIKNENFKYYSVEVSLLTHKIFIINGATDIMEKFRCYDLRRDLIKIIKRKYDFETQEIETDFELEFLNDHFKDWYKIKNKLWLNIDCDYGITLDSSTRSVIKEYFLVINYHFRDPELLEIVDKERKIFHKNYEEGRLEKIDSQGL